MHPAVVLDMIHGYVADPSPQMTEVIEVASYIVSVPEDDILDALDTTNPNMSDIARAASEARRAHGYVD